MSIRDRQLRYKASGGAADFIAVEVLVPRSDRNAILQLAEKCRARYRAKARRSAAHSLRIEDYPQLKLIAWSGAATGSIDEKDAYALYERNWRFIEPGQLTAGEKALIERLSAKFGHGLLHV
jgi:hypothetical protein